MLPASIGWARSKTTIAAWGTTVAARSRSHRTALPKATAIVATAITHPTIAVIATTTSAKTTATVVAIRVAASTVRWRTIGRRATSWTTTTGATICMAIMFQFSLCRHLTTQGRTTRQINTALHVNLNDHDCNLIAKGNDILWAHDLIVSKLRCAN